MPRLYFYLSFPGSPFFPPGLSRRNSILPQEWRHTSPFHGWHQSHPLALLGLESGDARCSAEVTGYHQFPVTTKHSSHFRAVSRMSDHSRFPLRAGLRCRQLRTFRAVEFEKRQFVMRPDPDLEVSVAINRKPVSNWMKPCTSSGTCFLHPGVPSRRPKVIHV